MDDSIIGSDSPDFQVSGPFSPAALGRTALAQLHEQAAAMRERGVPAEEIADKVALAAELWRARGAAIPDSALADLLPSTPDPAAILQARRVFACATWLLQHHQTEAAALILDFATALTPVLYQEDYSC